MTKKLTKKNCTTYDMRIRQVIQEQIPIGGNQSNTKSVDCIGPGEFMIQTDTGSCFFVFTVIPHKNQNICNNEVVFVQCNG